MPLVPNHSKNLASDTIRFYRMRSGVYPCSVRILSESIIAEAAIWCEEKIGQVSENWDYKVTRGAIFDFYFMDEHVAVEFKLLFG